MSLHAKLRDVDRTRAVQALTAWACADKDAFDHVIAEVDQDQPEGSIGLLLGLLEYVDWLTRNTGPLLPGDPGPP